MLHYKCTEILDIARGIILNVWQASNKATKPTGDVNENPWGCSNENANWVVGHGKREGGGMLQFPSAQTLPEYSYNSLNIKGWDQVQGSHFTLNILYIYIYTN